MFGCFLLLINIFIINVISYHVKSLIKVNVFSRGENGYYCIKIPDLILTNNNTYIAFGEARKDSCGDYAGTDLVYKRSFDNGLTWTSLKVLYSNSTLNISNVIGNAAPIQDNRGRIWVPFTRNNREVYMIYSDNDGETWSKPTGPLKYLTKDEWGWIGLGPPGSLLLKNGRIIIPGYHSLLHLDGDLSKGHVIYSDNNGDSWHLSDGIFGIGINNSRDEFFPSETQAIQLNNGSVLFNSRGMSSKRIGTISNDFGNTFLDSYFFNNLTDQETGCEGSMIKHPLSGNVYYTGLTETSLLRYNMTLSISINDGFTWNMIHYIDRWSSSYSSLVSVMDRSSKNIDVIAVLYERSEVITPVFVPERITFTLFEVSLTQ